MPLKGWKHARAHDQTVSRAVILWLAFTLKIFPRSLDWSNNLRFFCKISEHAMLTRLLGTLDWTVNQRSPSNVASRCRFCWEKLTCKEQINTRALHVCFALSGGGDNVAKTPVSSMILGLICELNSNYDMRPNPNHNSIHYSIVWWSEFYVETHNNWCCIKKKIAFYGF